MKIKIAWSLWPRIGWSLRGYREKADTKERFGDRTQSERGICSQKCEVQAGRRRWIECGNKPKKSFTVLGREVRQNLMETEIKENTHLLNFF